MKAIENIFSVYRSPIRGNKIPLKEVTLKDVHRVITKKYGDVTQQVRGAVDKKERNEIKASSLDYVTFSGTFTERSSNGLKEHSGLICVDIDGVDNISKLRVEIVQNLHPALLFVSPSGDGLKVVHKIDISRASHLDYFKALEAYYQKIHGVIIDEKCKDVARACFLCHDDQAIFSENSQLLDNSFIDTFPADAIVPQPAVNGQSVITDYDAIINILQTWIDKRESFVDGNRNNYITSFANALNRHGIPEDIALRHLLGFVRSDFTESEIGATVKSVYSHTERHGVATFETTTPHVHPLPAERKNEPTPLLPIDVFPEFIQRVINENTDVYMQPRDYIAGALLLSYSLAIGDKMELVEKYENNPLLWLAIVGDVSTGKTEPLDFALSFFAQNDKKEWAKYIKESAEYEATPAKEQKQLDKPMYFQYLLGDYTPEALYQAHLTNTRGLCIMNDELKGWFDNFNRYNKSGEQSQMLTTFLRKPVTINRATGERKVIRIDKPTIYVCGGIQPDLLPTLAHDNRAENGFLSRMLFVYPDNAKRPTERNNKTVSKETVREYYETLRVLTTLPQAVKLSLSGEADSIYSKWYAENSETINSEPMGYLKGVYGKLDIYALRLAVALHGMTYACDGNTKSEISGQTMRGAIKLTEYFRLTAKKVYNDIFAGGRTDFDNKDVIRFLSKRGASQNEIAKALKVKQPYISRILNQ